MESFVYSAACTADTEVLGKVLAETLTPGSVISLIGTLGAGKTLLVGAVAAALGVPDGEVASPTFVLVKEYVSGHIPVYHFDTYRLKDTDEFYELGPDEYFDADGFTFVEWGDRFEEVLPPDRLEIRITVLSETERSFELARKGGFSEEVFNLLAERLS